MLPVAQNEASTTAMQHSCMCQYTNYALVLTIIEHTLILMNYHVVLINLFSFYSDLFY